MVQPDGTKGVLVQPPRSSVAVLLLVVILLAAPPVLAGKGKEVTERILRESATFNKSTVGCQIIAGCVNQPSRHHYPGGEDRYWWLSPGKYRLYDPLQAHLASLHLLQHGSGEGRGARYGLFALAAFRRSSPRAGRS